MLKPFFKLIFIGISIFFLTRIDARAEIHSSKQLVPRRISSRYIDMGKPQTIYMVPGMATLIELPTPVHKIRVGNSKDVQYTKPKNPENEVTLFLTNPDAKPTNLFLISGKNKYIFDIVPSKTIHQDYIEVVGFFGGPEFEGSPSMKEDIIDSSDTPKIDNSKKEKRGNHANTP